MVMMVELVIVICSITKVSITLGCDGIGVLYQLVDVARYTSSSKQQYFDLLSGIQGYIRSSLIIYTLDGIIEMDKLDR